jgi:hypothetical protein
MWTQSVWTLPGEYGRASSSGAGVGSIKYCFEEQDSNSLPVPHSKK